MTGADTQTRTVLAEQLEQQAQQAEAAQEAGSPSLALAAHLRALIARLRERDGNNAPGRVG